MNKEERFLAEANAEALDQHSLTDAEFKATVKCCYNCRHWMRDTTLMCDYNYNACWAHHHGTLVYWAWVCDQYNGPSLEENYFNAEIRRLFGEVEND